MFMKLIHFYYRTNLISLFYFRKMRERERRRGKEREIANFIFIFIVLPARLAFEKITLGN